MTKNLSGAVLDRFPLSAEFTREADRFLDLVKSAKHVLISSTLTSDGDSVGAQLGILHLVRALRNHDNLKITIVNESEVPARYRFLDGASEIISIERYHSTLAKTSPKYDLGIVLDGGTERTGSCQALFEGVPTTLVDHHAVGSRLTYASKLHDLQSSSTCEIVYNLFEYFKIPMTAKIAESLYVGIIFDTGFFKHSLTKPRTHLVASELISTGIDFSEIADRAILERTWSGQLLLKKLLDNMERSSDGKIVHSSWSQKELEEIDFKDGDQEGMINQMYYVDTAEVVALFVESGKGQVKISFRSKGKVNVAEFARSLNPDGGGHVRASGCTMSGELQKIREEVVSKLGSLVGRNFENGGDS